MVDLDALERLHERATPGEWLRVRIPEEDGCVVVPHEDHEDIYREFDGEAVNIACATFSEADGALVVAARNALPDLLREMREARKIVEAARAVDETYAGSYRGFALLADTVNGVNLSPIGPRFDALRAALSRETTGGGE
jgi:hypothetical protein